MATTTLGGGCFWCLEAVFQRLEGVASVTSGYAGGQTPNPDYRSVCSGRTGHAEVVRVEFDPAVISFQTLLA
ncbi:MAG: peptide-methionine (S)-S-oxide reductase, partial [Spiribacter sp.]|nr:peptide-methionine (S)-S-oxide reductase [Spiribacter sp.]